MNIEHKNFIGIYENAFSPAFCQKAIEYFKNAHAAGYSYTRKSENQSTLVKNDTTVSLNTHLLSNPILDVSPAREQIAHTVNLQGCIELSQELNNVLWQQCYEDYAEKFEIIRHSAKHFSFYARLQKTEIGEGYHAWHYESGERAVSNRLLAWSVYLNDVEEGGETEFHYYPMRIKPKAGTMLIWPAGFTHTHRGNPPLSNTKYLITGWIEF